MKDMFKSKVMIGFIIFVLGFTYLNACNEQKKNDPDMEAQVIQQFEK